MLRFALPLLVGAALLVALVAAGAGDDPADRAARPANDADAPAAPEPPGTPVAIVWAADDLRAAARRLRRSNGVASASLLNRGTALLRATKSRSGRTVERVADGFAVPLDVVAVNPRGYAAALSGESREKVGTLRPGRAFLSETSARLRHAREGAELTLAGGRRLRVAGVLPDAAAQSAELVVHADDRRIDAEPRNVVAVLEPEGAPTPRRLARIAGGGARARYALDRSQDDLGPVTGGPARPAELKARFGEPSVALPYGNDWVRLDRGFLRRHIVTRRMPLLGPVTCHRRMMGPLRAAMSELSRRGLDRLVDPGDYAGCYAPRRIRPGGPLSLHAWGLAVDLNASANPFGGRSHQDRRLVRTMKRHGFTWGGEWPSVRDPMHFEWRGR